MITEHRPSDRDLPEPVRLVRDWMETVLGAAAGSTHAELIDAIKQFDHDPKRVKVCPAMPTALHRDLVLFVHDPDATDGAATEETVRTYLPRFHELDPREGPDVEDKAIVIVFPAIALADAFVAIDAVQAKIRPEVISAYDMMIGEMHPLNETVAVRTPESAQIYPNRSPVPTVALRSIVPRDWGRFLRRDLPLDAADSDVLVERQRRRAHQRALLRLGTHKTDADVQRARERVAALDEDIVALEERLAVSSE